MDKHGFYISKLVLRGSTKKDAMLEFKEGLNVIAGASDTGKSFAFECIDFLLGKRESLSNVEELLGYEDAFLEIVTYKNNKIITINRNIATKKMMIYNGEYSNIENIIPEEINSKHSKKQNNKRNISQILLSYCNCTYVEILDKLNSGSTRSFSFRDFFHLLAADETRITQKLSPIYTTDSKKNVARTSETSAFHTIIKGKDYSDMQNLKEDSYEIKVARINGKIEAIKQIKETLQDEVNNTLLNTHISCSSIQEEIYELQREVHSNKTLLNQSEIDKQNLVEQSYDLNGQLYFLEELNKKLKLLLNNYISDIERMEFIDEAEYYSAQLIDVACPLCNSQTKAEEISKEDYDIVKNAINIEQNKIRKQMIDLEETIENTERKIKIKKNKIEQIKKDIVVLEHDIERYLAPLISNKLSKLEGLYEKKKLLEKLEDRKNMIEKYGDQINQYLSMINNKKKDNKNIGKVRELDEEEIILFSNIFKAIVKGIHYSSNDIKFSISSNDFVIGNKEKSVFGKGSRAILNSIFYITIMLYCNEKSLSHPNIVILDSPLTTFRDKDKKSDRETHKEDIPKPVKEEFYRYLSQYDKGKQIIIFDNEIPTKDVIEKIRYYYFDNEINATRSGFIPE